MNKLLHKLQSDCIIEMIRSRDVDLCPFQTRSLTSFAVSPFDRDSGVAKSLKPDQFETMLILQGHPVSTVSMLPQPLLRAADGKSAVKLSRILQLFCLFHGEPAWLLTVPKRLKSNDDFKN